MNEKALTVQEKAFDLRDYLHSDKIKSQLDYALPKWLSVERLLRVFMGAIQKNPKLLNCSQESIMVSCMMCAQLGLEPILGRAWLIPYENSKNISGKWIKVLECQMQPGYQGLVDIGMRSGKILNVAAHMIYENDQYDIEYGSDEKIFHKPFLKGDRGDPIGAYSIWTHTNGYKSGLFLPVHDIHKVREKSKAYAYAISKPNDKYAQDTPWVQWYDEMCKKTVIKRHSKLQPASIEFMEAVEIDDRAQIGLPALLPETSSASLFDYSTEEDSAKNQIENNEPFQEIINELISKGIVPEAIEKFIRKVASENNMSVYEVEGSAVEDKESFIKAMIASVASESSEEEKLQAAQAKLDKKRRLDQDETKTKEEKTLFEKINTARSSFAGMCRRFKEDIEKMTDPEKASLTKRWHKLCPEEDIPFKVHTEEESPTPDDEVPKYKQEPDVPEYDPSGRMSFINNMQGYMAADLEKYREIMDANNFSTFNDVPQTKVDEDYILGALKQKFDEV